tara:strand:- start:3186 stop:4010 length:825 start_codon:yes stop_codon:yes gene_type:complete
MTLNFSGLAFNQAPDSQNQIHSDEMAKRYGFKGGLVPGVTLSAYLTQPAVSHWGQAFLDRGWAEIKILHPVYHAAPFDVVVGSLDDGHFEAELIDDTGKVCAKARVGLDADAATLRPQWQDQVLMPDGYSPPNATPETFAHIKQMGGLETRYHWSRQHPMARYFANGAAMPALLRFDGAAAESFGWANTSFVLSCANWVFAANARMNPWVHLETRHQNFAAIAEDTEVAVQMSVEDLFEKKGHQFADVRVNLFDAATQAPLASIWQRAIYHLRA